MNDKIVQGFAELKATLEENLAKPEDQKKKQEAARRAIERNDQEIIAEWRACGLEPLWTNGRPLSMSLAKNLGALQRQIEKGFSPSTAADLDEAV